MIYDQIESQILKSAYFHDSKMSYMASIEKLLPGLSPDIIESIYLAGAVNAINSGYLQQLHEIIGYNNKKNSEDK